MARIRKLEIGKYYHIVTRANRRAFIFNREGDIDIFYYLLYKASKMYPYTLLAFCIMNNHYHLLLQCQQIADYPRLMAYLNREYAKYYNKKYELVGHLWEKRYFSEEVFTRKSLLTVSTYIHYNPVEVQMTHQPQDYPHSSAIHYYENTSLTFLNTSILLDLFQGTEEQKRQAYINWMTEYRAQKEAVSDLSVAGTDKIRPSSSF